MYKKLNLKPIVNKANNQMNFSIKKNDLPKIIKSKLPKLKGIKLRVEDFEFK